MPNYTENVSTFNKTQLYTANDGFLPLAGMRYICCIYYFLLIFAGTVGNILGILVIRSSQSMNSSRGVFTALAVADSIVLWINPFRYLIIFISNHALDIRKVNVVLCKMQTFATYASRDWAANVLCLLTFERFLVACAPHKSRIYWTKRRKTTVWIMVMLFIIAKNLPVLVKLELIRNGSSRILCDSMDKIFRNVFFYVDITVYSIVPTILLLSFNIGLLHVLHTAQKQRVTLMGNTNKKRKTDQSSPPGKKPPTNSMDRSVHQANRLLIPVTMFHLVTSLPFCVFSIIEAKYNLKQSRDPRTFQITFILGYTFYMLSASSNGVNCLIYFLSSRCFRARLKKLLCSFRSAQQNDDSGFYSARFTPKHKYLQPPTNIELSGNTMQQSSSTNCHFNDNIL